MDFGEKIKGIGGEKSLPIFICIPFIRCRYSFYIIFIHLCIKYSKYAKKYSKNMEKMYKNMRQTVAFFL